MKVAISTDGGQVSAHFGRCPEFTIIDIKGGRIVNKEVVPNPGHSPGLIPDFIAKQGAQAIVCGGMGHRAQGFFGQMDIETIMGVTGSIEDVIQKLVDGTLEGGESLCTPGDGKGYGVEKTECDHPGEGE